MNITYMKDEELEMIAGGIGAIKHAEKNSIAINVSFKTKDVMVKVMVKAKGTGVELLGELLESILKGRVIYQQPDKALLQ